MPISDAFVATWDYSWHFDPVDDPRTRDLPILDTESRWVDEPPLDHRPLPRPLPRPTPRVRGTIGLETLDVALDAFDIELD